ncbi:MAG: nicotinate-nucleotide adenylyltransferase [Candidatus Omnitrophica bacterium]|nr:nicotinate-nucleotide adenylyltransferase [Candidatus Omnitrophota bacterium]
MRIGILGGTFNPIHIGHLILAEEACFKLKLDKVIFVPTFIPPHKEIAPSVKPKDRLKMVKLAIEKNPAFEVSRYEIDSKKKSYSIDTLKEFRKKYGEAAQLFFITGSDSLKDLFSWKDVNDIFKISKFIVANRPGYPVREVPKEVETVVITPIEVSSEDIRKRLKEARSIRYLVPEKVRNYIINRNLYK